MYRNQLPSVLTLLTLMTGLITANAHAFDDGEITPFHHPDWFKQSFLDLRDDLDDAREAGRKGVALLFTTQGCAYCRHMLQTTFADHEFAARLREGFDVIGLEMFADSEITDWSGDTLRVKQFAVREGAQFSPTLIFYDTDGRRLLRLVGFYPAHHLNSALDYLADADKPRNQAFRTWLEQHRVGDSAPAVARVRTEPSVAFTAAPLQLDRSRVAAAGPLLVVFGAQTCAPCFRFRRDVLSDPEVRLPLLGFHVVHLDSGDDETPLLTPQGQTTTPAAWYDELGFTRLPALAFFNEHGDGVLLTDAVVQRARLVNAVGYVEQRAYAHGWTFQRYARSESLRRLRESPGGD